MARVVGLTGGIASGKSAVAAILRDLGAAIVDADLVAREVVAPGTEAAAEIRARFGDAVFADDGRLDRAALGRIVFADPEGRRDLEAIIHPRIAAASRDRIAALAARGHDPVIYEAALLVENRLHEKLDGLIVVSVPEAVQIERLRARDGVDEAAARARIAAQAPLRDKLAVATWVIDNGDDLAALRAQVEALWVQLKEAP